ncbi:MAG: ExeM/NucH family extracellular endonuclease [Bacteroidota bacterium]
MPCRSFSLFLSLVFLLFSNLGLTAQTTLTAGDLAIIGVNTDNPDEFAFVLLVDIAAGTEIRFTDSGVRMDGTFRPNEGALKYTAPTALGRGTVINSITNATNFVADNDLGVGTGGFNLSGSGDQVIAFQGASTTPTFIYAVQTNSTQFQTGSDDSNQSDLPPGLVVGTTAVAVGFGSGAEDEFDNSTYGESVTSGTQAELLAAIGNPANWTGNNSPISPLAAGPYTVGSASTTSLLISPTNANKNEGDTGTTPFTFTVTRSGDVSGTTDVDFAITSTDIDASDTSGVTPVSRTLSFAATETSKVIIVTVTGDTDIEPDEDFAITISNPTGGATITTASAAGVIQDDDDPVAPVTIASMHGEDADGIADSLGVETIIDGIVVGVDLRGGSGVQFTIVDRNCNGIGVFRTSDVSGYAVTQGDSVRIFGSISQFNGLTQLSPDSIALLDQGLTIPDAKIITALNETTESVLITLEDVMIVDDAQWTGTGSGFNVDVTNGTDTFAMRIDSDVDLYSLSVPMGTFSVTGIGGQFDPSTPLNSGYQLLPRSSDDIVSSGTIANGVVPIAEIQGSGDVSPLVGDTVTTYGIVTGDFQEADELRGFFLQDPIGDGNDSTSEGIFVFIPQANSFFGTQVNVGDSISVRGNVKEFNTLTEIDFVSALTVHASGRSLPTQVQNVLPEVNDGDLERVEGMLVALDGMTVSQNFFLGRYGQMTLASPTDDGQRGRLFKPTNLFDAGSTGADSLAMANARRLIVLDDGQDVDALGDNPNPVPYLGSPPPAVIRSGDSISNLVGVIDFGRINSSQSNPGRDYRIHPTQAPTFHTVNARTTSPDPIDGRLKVAGFNVLNYFNGNGAGGGFPTARGARTPGEFAKQTDKIVEAIVGIDADVLGLMEIENDGYGTNSAIQDLVDAVNMKLGTNRYTFVDPGTSNWGQDVIAIGFLYDSTSVQIATGTTVAGLSTGEFTQAGGRRHRQPMAVTFEERATGEQFTAVVNHFKSKGSLTGIPGDEDQGDLQGNNNFSRSNASRDLATWLATDPTGTSDSDYIILGDINAYAQEDPLQLLADSGYMNVIRNEMGMEEYSFTFDGEAGSLDHILTSESLMAQNGGATIWHVSTDEPAVIDYTESFNPAGYYEVSPFRASDHDPIILGLNLGSVSTCGQDDIIVTAELMAITALPFTLQALQTITSDGTIEAGQSYIFQAGSTVELEPEFTVNAMGQLMIEIGPCNQ